MAMNRLSVLIHGFSLLVIVILAVNGQKTIKQNFVNVYNRCFRIENLPVAYAQKFNNFSYPDEPIVHRFVHCVWSDMGFWSDRSGFDGEAVAHSYKDKANIEILVPTLTECNAEGRNSETPTKWCYMAFQCILNSRVGEWYKNDVRSMMGQRRNA